MNTEVAEWRKKGKHLPEFLRDFHDQKNLFKALHELIDVQKHDYAKDVSWIKGQCYVIDIFLWFMARFGYTLQKTRTRLDFEGLSGAIDKCRKNRDLAFSKELNEFLNRGKE